MNCEQVQIAAMALADGESPLLSSAAIEEHVTECAECRREIAVLSELGQMWQGQTRQTHTVDSWPGIEGRIVQSERPWLPVLVAMLVVFKIIEFVPNRTFRTWVQLVPLLLAAAVFTVVGQNPFQIKTELRSQEESI